MLGGLALLAILAVAGAAAFGGAGLIIRNHYRKSNRVVPGVKSTAPTNWAGSHDPEAKLHRRLRDAVAGLRAILDGDPTQAAMAAKVEAEAIEIDKQLVASAHLAPRFKDRAMADLETAVARMEEISAHLLSSEARSSEDSIDEQLDDLSVRLNSMRQARIEVQAADDEGRRQTGTA